MQTVAAISIGNSRRVLWFAAFAALTILAASGLRAATIIKADNTATLNTTTSWIGGVVPGSGDTLTFNGAVGGLAAGNNSFLTGNGSTGQGGNLTVSGIVLQAGNSSTTGNIVINTINTAAGNTTAGNINIGSGGINLSAATENLALGNLTVVLMSGTNTQSWNVGVNQTLTVSSNINGSGQAITLDGPGRVVLGSGVTTLTNSSTNTNTTTVTVASTANLFVGETAYTTGTLFAGGQTTIVSIPNATTIVVANFPTAVTTASSTITFAATDAYTGGVTLNSGILALATSGTGLGTGALTINGGSLDAIAAVGIASPMNFNGNFNYLGSAPATLSGLITLNTSPGITINASTLTISGTISGSNGLTKLGNGTLALTALLNPYTGNTTINSGTLSIGTFLNAIQGDSLGQSGSSLASKIVIDGGTLNFVGTLGGSSDHLFSIGVANATLSESGTVPFDFSNTGSIGYNATSALPTSLTLTGGGAAGGSLELGLVDNPGGGALTVIKNGTGNWTLNETAGLNTYTGGTVVNAGVLFVNPTAFPATGNVLVNSGGMVASMSSLDSTFLGHISTLSAGTVGITSNTTNGSPLDFGAYSGLGLGAANGSFFYNGTITSSTGTVRLGGGTGQLELYQANELTGNINLTIVGVSGLAGNVSIGAAQSYTGTTNITGGTLYLTASNVLPTTGALSITGGTLNIGNFTDTSGPFTLNGGTVVGGSGGTGILKASSYLMQSGTLSSNVALGSFTKTGAGTLTFTDNLFHGDINVQQGTLNLGGTQPNSSTAIILNNGVTLSQTTVTTNSPILLTGGTATFSITTATFDPQILGSGILHFVTTSFPTNGVPADLLYGFGGTVMFDATADEWRNTSTMTASFATVDLGTGTGYLYANGTHLWSLGAILGNVSTALNAPNSSATVTYSIGSINSDFTYYGSIGNGNISTESAAITKVGTGTWTLTHNMYDFGTVTMAGGTLKLDFTQGASPTDLLGGNSTLRAPLSFGGGTLRILGNSSASVTTNQTFANVAVTAGGGTLLVSQNGGQGATVTLGSLTATAAGGALNLNESGSGISITSTTNRTVGTNNTDNTYGGRITFTDSTGATNWTTSTGSGNYVLSGFSSYTPLVGSGGNNSLNYLGTDSQTVTANETVNSVKLTTTQNGQMLDLGGMVLKLNNGGLLFTGANNYTVGNGTLASNLATNSDLILQDYGSGTLTINGVISNGIGNSTLTKAGPGVLVLAGPNTYTGVTYLNGGTTFISQDQNFGGGNGTITVAAGGSILSSPSVNLASATLPVGFGPGSVFLGRTVTAVNGVVVTLNGNALVAVGGSATSEPWATATNLNFNGGTVAANGSFTLNETSTVGGNTSTANRNVVIYGGGGTFNVSTGNTLTISGVISTQSNVNEGPLVKTGAGQLTLTGINTFEAQTIISGGTLSVGVMHNGNLVPVGSTGNVSGSLTGVLVNYTDGMGIGMSVTGSVNITAGTTIVGIDSANNTITLSSPIGNTSGFTPIVNGATLTVLPNDNLGNAVPVPISLVLDGGTLQYTGSNTSTNRGFTLTTNGGTLDASGTGTINLTGLVSIGFIGSGNRTLTLTGVNTGNNTLADPVVDGPGGSTSVTKNGSGTWQLVGAAATNTYTGNTTVLSGTLGLVDSTPNNIPSSPAIVVKSGATLDATGLSGGGLTLTGGASPQILTGAGTVKGVLTTAANSVVAPGDNGVGTITLAGLTANAGSIYTFEFASNSSYDQINVTNSGGLTLNGGGLNLLAVGSTTQKWLPNGPGGTVANQVYDLFQYTGTLGGNYTNLSILNPQAGFSYVFGTDGLGDITLTINGTPPIANWLATASGSWSAGGNWDQAVPTNSGDTANFNGTNTGAVSVTLDGDHSVGALAFTSSYSYSIAQGTGGNLTLDNQGASATVGVILGNHSITAPVILNDNVQVTVTNPADSLTIAGNISSNGTKGVTKLGNGLLALSGNNTYAGNTTLSAGTLQVGSNTALSSGNLAMTSNVELEAGADNLTLSNNLSIAGGFTGTIDAQTDNLTIAGLISDASGHGKLNVIGSGGTVILTANETYTGNTTVGVGGILQLGNGGASGNIIGNIFDNGTVSINQTRDITFANVMSGTGGFTQAGANTTTLSGANTFTGNVVVASGTLVLGASNTIQDSTLNYNNQSGGVLSFGTLGNVTLGGLIGAEDLAMVNASAAKVNLTFNPQGLPVVNTYTGNLSGTGNVIMTGLGTQVLTNANYTGNTTVNSGVLEIAGGTVNGGAITTSSSPNTQLYIHGGNVSSNTRSTLGDIHGLLVDGGQINFFGGLTAGTNGGDLISVSGGIFNASDLNLRRDNETTTTPYIPSIGVENMNVSGGTVSLGSLEVGTINASSLIKITGGSVLATGNVLVGDDPGGTGRYSMIYLTGGNFTSTDTVNGLTLGASTFTVNATTGTVSSNANNAELLLQGGTASVQKISIGQNTSIAGDTVIWLNGGTLYIGSGGIVPVGTGMTTNITLQGGVLGASADWATAYGMTLASGSNTTIQTADSNGVAQNITLNGTIGGSGALAKSGAGTLTLSGASTYSGGTSINAGTLAVTGSNSLGTAGGALTINNGILEIAASGNLISSSRNVTLGTANATVQVDAGKTYINSGYWTGSGNLNKTGDGLLYLTGNNSYTGATTINSGTLSVNFLANGGQAVNPTGPSVVTTGPFSQNNRDDRLTTNSVTVTVDSLAGIFIGQTVTSSSGIASGTKVANFTSTYNSTANTTTYTVTLSANATATTSTANLTFGGNYTISNVDTSTLAVGETVIGGNVLVPSTITSIDSTNNTFNINRPSPGSGNTSLVWVQANSLGAADNTPNSLVINGGALDFNALAGNDSWTDRLFTLGADGGTLSVSGGANVTFNNGGLLAVPVGTTLTLDGSNSGYGVLGATIPDGLDSNPTSVTKNGTGLWYLAGSSSYTGATTVNAGVLELAGSLGTTAVTVKGGATLAGSGTIAGPVTVNTGGILNPGDALSLGTLTVANLTLANNAVVNLKNQDGVGMDQIAATNLTLGGAAKLNLYSFDGANLNVLTTIGTYTLISYNGTFSGDPSQLTVLNVDPVLNYTFTNNGTADLLTVTLTLAGDLLTWTGDTGNDGVWSDSGAWLNGTIGDGAGKRVAFGDNSFAGNTANVTLDGNHTIGELIFNTSNKSFTITATGGSILTMNNGGNASLVEVIAGNHTVAVPINSTGNDTVIGLFPNTGLQLAGNLTTGNYLDLNVGTGSALAVSGSISQAGTTNLTVTAAGGSVALTGTSSYTGYNDIDNTTLTVAKLADGGSNSSIGASSNAAVNLRLDGTTILYTGSGDSTDRLFTIEHDLSGTAGISSSGTGAINFTNPGALAFEGVNTINTITLSGTYTSSVNTFNPIISDNGLGRTSLAIVGPATWALGTNNTYGGVTTVTGGTVVASALNNVAVTTAYTSVAASSILTNVTTASKLSVGETIGGNNVVAGSLIVAIDAANRTITLNSTAIGSGNDTLTASSQATSLGSVANASVITIDNGTLVYTGPVAISSRQLAVGPSGNLTLIADGTGPISFNSTAALVFNGTGNNVITLGGSNTGQNIFAAYLANGSGQSLTSVVKQDAGTWELTNTSSTYSGGTTINGGILQISNLAALGNVAGNLTINNGAIEFTGNVSTNRSFYLGGSNSTVIVDQGMTVTYGTGQLTGNALTVSGNGTFFLNATANNTAFGVVGGNGTAGNLTTRSANLTIAGGSTLSLQTANATIGDGALNGVGNITFGNGTLVMNLSAADAGSGAQNQYIAANLFIPAGESGNITLPYRGGLSGNLTGNGTLNLFPTYVRGEITGNWSGFTGLINVDTASTTTTSTVDFRLSNSYGFGTAQLNLAAHTDMYVNGGGSVTLSIGALSGSGTVYGTLTNASTVVWQVGGANTDAQFDGPILNNGSGGTTSIIKTGTGNWTLTGNNTFGGPTIIASGALVVGASGLSGNLGSSVIEDDSNLVFNRSGTILGTNLTTSTATISNLIGGTGNVIQSGSGTLKLTGANSYTGQTVVNSGTLSVSSISNGGLVLVGAQIIGSAPSIANATTVNGTTAVTVASTGNLVVGQIISGAGIAGNTSIIAIDSGNNIITLSQPAVGDQIANSTLSFGGLNTVTVSSATTLTLGQTLTGPGIPVGATIVAIDGVNNIVTLSVNGTVTGTTNVTYFNANNLGGASNAAGNLVLNNSAALAYTGSGNSSDRIISIGTYGATLDASGSGALNLTNNAVMPVDPSSNFQYLVLTGTNTGSNTLAAGIGDGLNGQTTLFKNGPGSWILTNNNTYTGGTTINSGTLVVANAVGSGTGPGVVTVNANSTLGGTGNVDGPVTVNAGGRLRPGTSAIGTLSVGSLSLNSGAIINFGFTSNGSANDIVNVTGTDGFSFADGTIFNLYNQNTLSHFNAIGNYTLVNFNGVVTGNAALLSSFLGTASLGYDFTFTEGATSLNLQISLSQGVDNWVASGDGVWGNAANWFGGVQIGGGAGMPAIFGAVNTGPATITMAGTQTVGTLVLNSPNPYTITASSGSLIMDGGGFGPAQINVDGDVTDTISAPVVLAANGTAVQVSESNALVISGNVSEQVASTNLSFTGSGVVTLSGNNTYSGTTTLASGTLNLNTPHAIGSGNFVIGDGATVDNTSGVPVTLTTNNRQEWQGNVGFTGSSDLNLGLGNVTLDQSSTLNLGGGNLVVGGNIAGNSSASASNLAVTGNGSFTVGGNISGSTTAVSVTGPVSLMLAGGNNSYAAGTTINAATLTATANGALPSGGNVSILNGAVLAIGTTNDTVGSLTLTNGTITGTGSLAGTANSVFRVQNGTVTVNLGGSASFTKSTSGVVTLTGNNSYSGLTTVSGGTLLLNGNNSFASGIPGTLISGGNLVMGSSDILSDSGTVTISSGALTMGVNNDTVGAVRFAGGNITGSGNLTSVGNITATGTGTIFPNLAGTGSFTQSGGNVTLAGNYSYTGDTFVSGGTLNLLGVSSGAGNVTMSGGRINFYNPAGFSTGTMTLSGGTLNNATGATYTVANVQNWGGNFAVVATNGVAFSNVISLQNSDRQLTVTGGTVTLSNTMLGGGRTFTMGGSNSTLVVTGSMLLDSTASAGRFAITGSNTTVVLDAGAAVSASWVNNGGTSTGWNSIGTGANDNNTLTLNGNATFTSDRELGVADIGATTSGLAKATINVNDTATLTLLDLWVAKGSSNSNASSTAIVNQNGGLVDLTGNNVSVSPTAGAGGLILGGGWAASNTTTGTYYTNNATYNLNGGTLITYAIRAQDLGNGTATFNFNGGTLQPSNNTVALMTNSLTAANVQAGGATINTNGYNATLAQNLTTDPALGNTTDGGLTKNGNGTLALTGTNSYTGNTVINGGALQIGDGNNTGTLGAAGIINYSTLALNRNDTVTLANAVSGNGTLAQLGTGTTVLTATNTYTGGTSIVAGTLQVGNGSTAGTLGSGAITDNGTLAYNHSDALSVSDTISGNGTLAHLGGGNLTLLAANSYTGGTLIASGNLFVGNGTAAGLLGTGAITDNGTLVYNHSDNVAVADVISGLGGLTKLGTGNLTISGTNTYTGNTVVGSGVIQISGAGSLGAGASTVVMNGGTILAGLTTLDNTFTGTGGTIAATGGDLEIGDGGSAAGVNFTTTSGVINTGSHAVTIDSTGFNTVGGVVMSAGGVLNATHGIQLLTGGSLTASGNATVNGSFLNPTIFSGNYTDNDPINGDPIYNSSSIQGPSGAAKLTFTSQLLGGGNLSGNIRLTAGSNFGLNHDSLTQQGAGTTYYGGGSPLPLAIYNSGNGTNGQRGQNYDAITFASGGFIDLTDTTNGGVTLVITLSSYSPVAGDTYKLFKYSGTPGVTSGFVGTFSTIDTSGAVLGSGLTWDFSAIYTTGVLDVLVAVPEPSTLAALFGVVALGAAVLIRRRQARAAAVAATAKAV